MPAQFVDGIYPTGAPIISIGGFTYKCNKLSLDKPAGKEDIHDPDGAHAGFTSWTEARTGTVEFQFANVNVPEPTTAAANSATGIFLANVDGANVNCAIMHVSIERPSRGPWTGTAQFQVKQN